MPSGTLEAEPHYASFCFSGFAGAGQRETTALPPAAQLERFVLVPRRERAALSVLKEINAEYSLEGLMNEAESLILWPPDSKS